VTACRTAADADVLHTATDPLLADRHAEAGDDDPELKVARSLVEATAGKLSAEARLVDLATRVDSAQQLANMGDHDWHIASDTTTWSDQLYRIFGVEPQSFHPSYEVYLARIHPDDQEGSREVHRRALATGEPYQRISRLIRPDGEVRYLSSSGEVIQDADGTPLRVRGTSVDITDLIRAQQEASRSDRRFRRLVESYPDAILVLDRDRLVVQANLRAEELFEGDPVGQPMADLMPDADFEGLDLPARSLTGEELRLDVVLARVADDDADSPDHDLSAAFIRYAGPRLAQEELSARLREAVVRRRQALELNDSVVQGLTAAVLAQAQGQTDEATTHLEQTMAAARRLMNDWIEPVDKAAVGAGDLVRSTSSGLGDAQRVGEPVVPDPAEPPATSAPVRVLVVDDNDDVRRLLTIQLETGGACAVVGDAADGRHAVELAKELQPDVVVLDLAMPVMDGLEALPLIKAAVPDVKVIVLSGFDEGPMRDRALQAGASKYVEKGVRMGLAGHIDELVGRPRS